MKRSETETASRSNRLLKYQTENKLDTVLFTELRLNMFHAYQMYAQVYSSMDLFITTN